jgi:hypothetical protein
MTAVTFSILILSVYNLAYGFSNQYRLGASKLSQGARRKTGYITSRSWDDPNVVGPLYCKQSGEWVPNRDPRLDRLRVEFRRQQVFFNSSLLVSLLDCYRRHIHTLLQGYLSILKSIAFSDEQRLQHNHARCFESPRVSAVPGSLVTSSMLFHAYIDLGPSVLHAG